MPTDRRTPCLTCGGRCDPDKWTCRRCHDRLITGLLVELAEDAYQEARKAEGVPSTSQNGVSGL